MWTNDAWSLCKVMKTSETRNNSGIEAAREGEGREKKAPVVDRPAEVRFNGDNLHGVFHHCKGVAA